uniref:PqqD family protein n=1 Tax=Thermodesulfobium narugense TaxID=184064 RepID=A0A7C5PGT8_9BACT
MLGFKKNNNNLLMMYPVKNSNISEEVINGQLRLIVYHAGFLRKIFERWFPNYGKSFINLDEYGQFVWQHCNGNYNVKDILVNMQNHFKNESELTLERLVVFIRILVNNNLVKLIKTK